MKKAIFVVSVMLLLAPVRSHADPTGWVTGENEAIIATAINTMNSALHLEKVLANAKEVLQATNEMAAYTRQAYQAVQIIRTYDWDQLKRDAWHGLTTALPELAELKREVDILNQETQAVNDGRFFTHWSRYDPKMRSLLRRQFTYAYRATLWPLIYPELRQDAPPSTPVDELVIKRFQDAGMAYQRAVEATAMGAMAMEISSLAKDAKEKDSLETRLNATQAQLALQTADNSERIADHMDLIAAQQQSSLEASRMVNAMMKQMYERHAMSLITPLMLMPADAKER